MHTKLAAFFAFLAFVMLTFTWCLNYMVGVKVLGVVHVLLAGLAALMIYFFFIGRYLARIGIALVEEALSDMRAREEEHRRQMLKRLMPQEATEQAPAEPPAAPVQTGVAAKAAPRVAGAKAEAAGKAAPAAGGAPAEAKAEQGAKAARPARGDTGIQQKGGKGEAVQKGVKP